MRSSRPSKGSSPLSLGLSAGFASADKELVVTAPLEREAHDSLVVSTDPLLSFLRVDLLVSVGQPGCTVL